MAFVRVNMPNNKGYDLNSRVRGFYYEGDIKKSNKATLKLDNWDNQLEEWGILEEEQEFEIQFGNQNYISHKLSFILHKSKQGKTLNLELKPQTFKLDKEKKRKTWNETKPQWIVEEIAENYGFSIDYHNSNIGLDVEIDERFNKEIDFIQRTTDARALKKLATKTRCRFWIDFAGFHFVDIQKLKTRRHDFVKGQANSPYQLLAFKGVETKNVKGVKTYDLQVPQDIGETLEYKEEYDFGAYDIKGEVLEENTETNMSATEQGLLGENETIYIESSADNITLKYDVLGHAGLIEGDNIGIWNIGEYYSGLYILTNVKHSVENGYISEITIKKQGVKRKKSKKIKGKKEEGQTYQLQDHNHPLSKDEYWNEVEEARKKSGKQAVQANNNNKTKIEIVNVYNPETRKYEKIKRVVKS